MSELRKVLKTLEQLEFKMDRGHWEDIHILEEEDKRYSTALQEAIEIICRLEDLLR